MRALGHPLLLPAVATAALLLFVAPQARAADPASVVSQVQAADLPATTADPAAAAAPTNADTPLPRAQIHRTTPPTTFRTGPEHRSDGCSSGPVTPPAPPTPPPPPPTSPPTAPAPSVRRRLPLRPQRRTRPPRLSRRCRSRDVCRTVRAGVRPKWRRSRTRPSTRRPPSTPTASTRRRPPATSSRSRSAAPARVSEPRPRAREPGWGPTSCRSLCSRSASPTRCRPAPISGAVHNTASQTSSQLQVGRATRNPRHRAPPRRTSRSRHSAPTSSQTAPRRRSPRSRSAVCSICHGTSQQQIATQSNTTVDVAPSAASVSTVTASAVSNVTDQLIWQLQIGCLMWCWDATQDQSASSDDALIELPFSGPHPRRSRRTHSSLRTPGRRPPRARRSVPAPSAPAAPPGVTAPPPSLAPSPAFAATQSTSPPAAGADTPTPAGSAIDVGGVVFQGSVSSGAWSGALGRRSDVTEAASPARPPSLPRRGAVPVSRVRGRASAGRYCVVRSADRDVVERVRLGLAVHARRRPGTSTSRTDSAARPAGRHRRDRRLLGQMPAAPTRAGDRTGRVRADRSAGGRCGMAAQIG